MFYTNHYFITKLIFVTCVIFNIPALTFLNQTNDNGANPKIQNLSALDIPTTVEIKKYAEIALKAVVNKRLVDWNSEMKFVGTNWNEIFKLSLDSPRIRSFLFEILKSAQDTLNANPIRYERPFKFEQIPQDKVNPIAFKQGLNRDLVALAYYDCDQADFLRSKVVELAIAARYSERFSDDQSFKNKLIQILRSVTKWRPLQRPGWTLTDPSITLSKDGDGPFLATSWGISGIVEILDIMGDRIPNDLRLELRNLLREEILEITKAWALKIPWYVKVNETESNQWVDPTSALLKACLFLNEASLLTAYQLGTENLAAFLATSGNDGAFLEGISYAQMSLGGVFETLSLLKKNNDLRCHEFPFVNNCWKWILNMCLPGNYLVNSYDSRIGRLPAWAIKSPLSSLSCAVLASTDNAGIENVKYLFPEGISTKEGLEYEFAIQDVKANNNVNIPTFAYFESQQQIVWRSKYERPQDPQSAFAIWLRGGSLRDSHSHRDQGQVSIYCGNRVILMECGTPDYSNPLLNSHYANAAGHGIMQIGEISPRNLPVDAPIIIKELNADGGSAVINTTKAYSSTVNCTRQVDWSKEGNITIHDNVKFKNIVKAGGEIYRFHTGSNRPIEIKGSDNNWQINWLGVKFILNSNHPIQVNQCSWPDSVCPPYAHQVIIIKNISDITTEFTLSSFISIDINIIN